MKKNIPALLGIIIWLAVIVSYGFRFNLIKLAKNIDYPVCAVLDYKSKLNHDFPLLSGIKVMEGPCPGVNSEGCYNPLFDTITLVDIDSRGSTFVFLHEVGHKIWHMYLVESEKEDFEQYYQDSKDEGRLGFVSDYAMTSVSEDFAETFAFTYLELYDVCVNTDNDTCELKMAYMSILIDKIPEEGLFGN